MAASLVSLYGLSLAMTALAFPLGFHLLRDRPDRGLAGARVLALVMAALAQRSLASLHVPPWSETLGMVAFVALISIWLLWVWHWRGALRNWLSSFRHQALHLELAFVIALLLAVSLLRISFETTDGERLMDMALLMTAATAGAFPPPDLWFAGYAVAYHWLGQQMAALLIAAARMDFIDGYHWALAFFFACIAPLILGIARGDEHKPHAGWLAAVAATLGGPLVWMNTRPAAGDAVALTDATRIIDGAVTEVPLASLLVGDLHAHFLLLPAFLTLVMWYYTDAPTDASRSTPATVSGVVVVNALLMGLWWGNPWSYPAALLVMVLCHLRGNGRWPFWTAMPSIMWITFAGPDTQTSLALAWVSSAQTTGPGELLILYGIPLALIAVRLLAARPLHLPRNGLILIALATAGAALHSLSAALLILLLALAAMVPLGLRDNVFTLSTVAALTLLLIPEWVYLDDPYLPPYERFNTVFKLHYLAWPLLMIAAARAAWQLAAISRPGVQRRRFGLALVLAAVFLFPAQSLPARWTANATGTPESGVGHDGHTTDFALVDWLAANMEPDHFCLEAASGAYDWAGRVSAFSACPTLIGWYRHQLLWRADHHEVRRRIADVDRIYTDPDPRVRAELLTRYDIDWVIVGEEERARYTAEQLAVFEQFLVPAYRFQSGLIFGVQSMPGTAGLGQ